MQILHRRWYTILILIAIGVICYLCLTKKYQPNDQHRLINKFTLINKSSSGVQQKKNFSIGKLTGDEFLKQIEPPFPALLIDVDFLKTFGTKNRKIPENPLKVAVPVHLLDSLKQNNNDKYDVILYEIVSGRDYIKIFSNITRAIPLIEFRTVGNWSIPKDIPLFLEYWRRSPLLECLGLNMNRTKVGSKLPIKESIDSLANLRNLLVSLGMFAFLIEGTLLGWYRECGLIPHTQDMDFAVLVEEHNPEFLKLLLENKTDFRINRKIGKLEDNYEFTVVHKDLHKAYIDIFFMYNDGKNESWIGGTQPFSGEKYHFTFPLYDPYCSADLMGHLFWVSCRPKTMVLFEYGPAFKKDHETNKFSWNESQNNVRKAGKWKSEEMKEVFKHYPT